MVTPEVVGHIDPVCFVELNDEREAGNRRAGLAGGPTVIQRIPPYPTSLRTS
jgi:hypothetical protein